MKNLIVIIILSALSHPSLARIQGEDLLSYFQSSCQSQGEFTKKAMGDARGLVSVLETLRADPVCQGVFSQAGRISNIESYVSEKEYE